jgi:hypothetical protein
MSGDERVRFCGECRKNVYNLSEMSREQAEQLVREKEGDLCVRFYRRKDGTVLTSDCPVGVRRRRVRRVGLAAGISAALSASALVTASARMGSPALGVTAAAVPLPVSPGSEELGEPLTMGLLGKPAAVSTGPKTARKP